MRRRLPRPAELRHLVHVEAPALARPAVRLRRAADVRDLRDLARRTTPRAAFDYVDGAAGGEEGMRRNLEVFRELELRPDVLRDVGEVDLAVDVLGRRSCLPVGIAPTGFTRMMHTEGEVAGVRAADRAGVPFTLSTMGTTSIEDVAAAAPDARRWFQLYLWRDRRELSLELLERARASGYDVLLVTVDTPTGGLRHRDARNGMTIPPRLTAGTVLDAARRPRWWWDFLTTEPLHFATLSESTSQTSQVIGTMFDPTLSFDDLAWLRSAWPGPLVVKGIQGVDDARRAVDHGADGIYLSNHGGRQLDRPPVPLRVLPQVREAVGPEVTVVVDSGITTGGDVLAALALGADLTMIGRAYLYGLMAGGEAGVARVLEILEREMRVTAQLMGVRSVAELEPRHVALDRRA